MTQRFVVTQGSERWGQESWWNVYDQMKDCSIARCEDRADAMNIVVALNTHSVLIPKLLATLEPFTTIKIDMATSVVLGRSFTNIVRHAREVVTEVKQTCTQRRT